MTSPISRFQIVSDRLATGAQPKAEDFAWIRDQGYDAVFNINGPTARNYLASEADLVRGLGLGYLEVPFDCTTLTAEKYEAFEAALDSFGDRRVFVHCAGNVKSSGLMHVYRVRRCAEDARHALSELEKIGAGHEPKWFQFFDVMGAAPGNVPE